MSNSSETYPIVGVQTGQGPKPGQIPLRIEIDDFYNDPARAIQLDLLYRALHIFQEIPFEEKLSYFQIAGIHGYPLTTWDDPTKPPGTERPIYCEHGTVLFGTWHRPYMALFEQRLHEIMNTIVASYLDPDAREVLQKEVDQFRLPYWDWAVKKPRIDDSGKEILVFDLPLIVKNEEVKVSNSAGGVDTIDNPFYNFKSTKPMGDYKVGPVSLNWIGTIPFNLAKATSRHPDNPNKNANNLNAFSEGIQKNQAAAQDIRNVDFSPVKTENWPLQDAVYRLLSPGYSETYYDFVTMATRPKDSRPDPRRYLSLEFIHGNMHGNIGGEYGHMGHVPVAAFDPIFYLHHCNIDRLLAIWQSINPDKWFEEQTSGQKLSPTTPLEPFHLDKAGTFYTSETARNHFDFGSSYPELQRWNFESEKEYIAHINKEVERLYGPSATTQLRLAHHDAVINVSFEKFALNGAPFTVSIFLQGESIGKVENFSFVSEDREDGTVACENCRQQRDNDVVVTGQVTATLALIKAAEDPNNTELKVLDRESIAAYLKKHLSWRVTVAGGEEVEIQSLKVFPAIGRRNVNLLTEPGNAGGPVVNKPGAGHPKGGKHFLKHGVVDLPSITPEVILDTKASYGKNGIIEVHDNHNPDKVYKLEVAGWGTYESIF